MTSSTVGLNSYWQSANTDAQNGSTTVTKRDGANTKVTKEDGANTTVTKEEVKLGFSYSPYVVCESVVCMLVE